MIIRWAAAARGASESLGVSSLHCLSAGSYYDPANVSFGPVVGLDEHVLIPGGGFDWHAHRGVSIVSWVVSGALRHESSSGPSVVVGAGELLVQSTGEGIRHRETSAATDSLTRLVQLTLLGSAGRSSELVSCGSGPGSGSVGPVSVGPVTVELRTDECSLRNGIVFVGCGSFGWPGGQLWAGDSLRVDDESVSLTGAGNALLVRF